MLLADMLNLATRLALGQIDRQGRDAATRPNHSVLQRPATSIFLQSDLFFFATLRMQSCVSHVYIIHACKAQLSAMALDQTEFCL